jgi:hypothetical protein
MPPITCFPREEKVGVTLNAVPVEEWEQATESNQLGVYTGLSSYLD